jgi:hypothetical protein
MSSEPTPPLLQRKSGHFALCIVVPQKIHPPYCKLLQGRGSLLFTLHYPQNSYSVSDEWDFTFDIILSFFLVTLFNLKFKIKLLRSSQAKMSWKLSSNSWNTICPYLIRLALATFSACVFLITTLLCVCECICVQVCMREYSCQIQSCSININ